MSQIPRILPLVAIAIGGVVAANLLSGAHAIPQLFSATQAVAEEALSPSKSGRRAKPADPAPAASAAKTTPLPSGDQAAAATPIAPICAPSPAELAKAAGLSPAELQVLQSLQTRRGQIDTREKDLDTEVQLLAAAETKLDAKLKAMNTLKSDIQALMGQADQKTQAEVDRLVVVYSKMRPQDSAAIMAQLDDKVRLPIAAAMKPATLSAILGKMGTVEAKVLTEKLAHRFAPVQAVAEAANAPATSAKPPVLATPDAAPEAPAADADPTISKPAKQARKTRKVAVQRRKPGLIRRASPIRTAETTTVSPGPHPYGGPKIKAATDPPPTAPPPAKSS